MSTAGDHLATSSRQPRGRTMRHLPRTLAALGIATLAAGASAYDT